MDRKQLLVNMAAILTTLEEVGTGAPESMLYMGIGCNLSDWMTLRAIMVEAGLINVSGHLVTLTEEGKIKAQEINAKLGKVVK